MARLCTLGGLWLEGSDFTRPKPLLLLTYVALEGPQVRRHIAELFWPEARDSMKSLTVALTRLRQGAPGVIETDGKRLWSYIPVDVKDLLNLLDKGEVMAALELYQAPFLEGIYLSNWSSELEEWVCRTREFLSRYLSRSLLNCAESAAARGQYTTATACAEAICDVADTSVLEPEELKRLHTLLAATDNPHATMIAEESRDFGLILSSDSEVAKARLHGHLSKGALGIPSNLPTARTTFIGRDSELVRITKLLSQPEYRLVTLLGSAGVGKTRLALQLAHQLHLSERFKGGVYWVALEALFSPERIPVAIAEALNLESLSADAAFEHLSSAIGSQEILIFLDNAEHLTDGASHLSDLIARCPNLTLLVTSRERLNIAEEYAVRITGLSFPANNLTLDKANHFSAVNLFVKRGKAARPDFELRENNLADIVRICHLVDGLPLGLELAAAWLRMMPPAGIADEISRHLDFLTTHLRDTPDRHRSIQSAYEHSWAGLNDRERAALRRLAVFKGGFRREAASEVAGASITILASLLDKSLLRVGISGRYDQHPLLYQFTREKLAQYPDELAAVSDAHARHFLGFVEGLRPGLLRPAETGEQRALRALALEHENLRAALTWSTQHNKPLALQLTSALQSYWEMCGNLSEACSWFGRALKGASEEIPAALRTRAFLAHGRFLLLCGEQEQAAEAFQTALVLAQQARRLRDIAEASNHLGLLALEHGEVARAKSFCEKSLKVHHQLNNQRGIAVTHNNLGNIARAARSWAEAEGHYSESLVLNRRLGIKRSEAIVLANLSFVACRQRQPLRAAGLLRMSIAIREALRDEVGLAHSFVALARLLCAWQYDARAALLLGAADSLLRTTRVVLSRVDRREYRRSSQDSFSRLLPEVYSACWQRGYSAPTRVITRYALRLINAIMDSLKQPRL
jgi:predicted ATPase